MRLNENLAWIFLAAAAFLCTFRQRRRQQPCVVDSKVFTHPSRSVLCTWTKAAASKAVFHSFLMRSSSGEVTDNFPTGFKSNLNPFLGEEGASLNVCLSVVFHSLALLLVVERCLGHWWLECFKNSGWASRSPKSTFLVFVRYPSRKLSSYVKAKNCT